MIPLPAPLSRLLEPPAPPALAPFDAAVRGPWAWRQPDRFRSRWILFAGDAPVLALTRRGLLRARADARTSEGAWTLQPRLLADVTVTAAGASVPCARLRGSLLGNGRIECRDGSALAWRRESFWGRRYGIRTTDALPLVHVVPHWSFLRQESEVVIEDAARRRNDLPELLALGWFLVLRQHRRHAAAH